MLDLGGDRGRGAAVVAGEHDHVEPEVAQAADRRRRLALDGVGHGDQRRRDGRRRRRRRPSCRRRAALPRPRRPAGRPGGRCRSTISWPSTTARTPWPARASKRSAGGATMPRSSAAASSAAASGCSEPRSAAAARRSTSSSPSARHSAGRRPRRPPRRPVAEQHDVGDARLALGDRAGLVEHDGVELVRRLERGAVADQDPVLGALAGADHDRRRRGQPERAGARDHEHGDEVEQRVRERGLRADDEPDDERERGDADDGGHEVARDHVGEARDRRLGALRLLDEAHDLRQRRLAADAGGAERERARRVEGGADDLVAGLLEARDRLAGQHRLVDGRAALDDAPRRPAPSRRAARAPGRRRRRRRSARRPRRRRAPRAPCAAAGR